MFLLCLFLEIKVLKGHIRSIYIKGVFIDSNKLDKHHKQYSKYGKKYSVVKLPKRYTVSELFGVFTKKQVPKW